MKKSSWKTTVGGILMALGTPLSTASMPEGWEWINQLGIAFTSAGGLILGLAARDNDVSSEEAGVKGTGDGKS